MYEIQKKVKNRLHLLNAAIVSYLSPVVTNPFATRDFSNVITQLTEYFYGIPMPNCSAFWLKDVILQARESQLEAFYLLGNQEHMIQPNTMPFDDHSRFFVPNETYDGWVEILHFDAKTRRAAWNEEIRVFYLEKESAHA